MRKNLRFIYPEIFSTILVPKADELIASKYRHHGSIPEAKTFFEKGMLAACRKLYQYSRNDLPVTIYYAYKQSDADEDGVVSSGWETMLSAVINAGFTITGTWPIRTEMVNRTIASNANALASSIVLVCRKRAESAQIISKRDFLNQLRRELKSSLKNLLSSNIAPVDLAQSAIGPGMGIFSRYKKVLEADGSSMTVRSALRIINDEIDHYFNAQVGSMDSQSRFCVELFSQCAFNNIAFGEAELLATAKSISIPMMESRGFLYAKAGKVHLIPRDALPDKVDPEEKCVWLLTQQLTKAMSKGGINACAEILKNMYGSNTERARDLAYRLHTISERKGWSSEAYAYNALVAAWPDIQAKAAAIRERVPKQLDLFDTDPVYQFE